MLGVEYFGGAGVKQNRAKAMHYYRIAAIGGVLEFREMLGDIAYCSDNMQLAMKHYIIAAEGGHDMCLGQVSQDGYLKGHMTKEAFEMALPAHKSSVDEMMKSEQRDAAARYRVRNPHLCIK